MGSISQMLHPSCYDLAPEGGTGKGEKCLPGFTAKVEGHQRHVARVVPTPVTYQIGDGKVIGEKLDMFPTQRRRRAPGVDEPAHDLPVAAADGWIHVDRHTLETDFKNVYAIGDCTQIPTGKNGQLPKAGLFAEKEGEVVGRRIAARLAGQEPTSTLDGQALCCVETGPSNKC